MLESIFLIMIAMAFMLFLISVYEQSFVFMLMSTVMWLILMASALGVEVPFVDDAYVSYSFSAISMLFVFASVVLSIVYIVEWRRRGNMP